MSIPDFNILSIFLNHIKIGYININHFLFCKLHHQKNGLHQPPEKALP